MSLAGSREGRGDPAGIALERAGLGGEVAALVPEAPEPAPVPAVSTPASASPGAAVPSARVEITTRDAVLGTTAEARYDTYVPCPACGENESAEACSECGGAGRVAVTHVVPLRVPAGAADGQRISLETPDGAYAVLRIRPDEPAPGVANALVVVGSAAAMGLLAYLLFFL